MKISVSVPGRVCLFGEDIDYMGLETITLAINKRIEVLGNINNNGEIVVKLEDIGRIIKFRNKKQKIRKNRDYIKSVFNIFKNHLPENFGAKIRIKSTLPIGKGLSSSSAFCVALVGFFGKASQSGLNPKEIAEIAFKAEVQNMGESGGMMDHFATSVGGLLHLECRPPYNFERISNKIDGLVIGDTLIRKRKTIQALARRKQEAQQGIQHMQQINKEFSMADYPTDLVIEELEKRPSIGLKRLVGMMGIRDTVRKGYQILKEKSINQEYLAELINNHHFYQTKYFENVIEKMNSLVLVAKNAGAKACKLLGTGDGGSFLAFAPNYTDEVVEAIMKAGGEAYLVKQNQGIKIKTEP